MKLDQPLNLDFSVDEELLSQRGIKGEAPYEKAIRIPVSFENDKVLEDAVRHWRVGDWKHLAKLDNAKLPDTESRQYLAILAATGHQYLDDAEAEMRCTNLAIKWGATKEEAKTMLLSGIYNRLGRASVLSEDYVEAAKYFVKALDTTIFPSDNSNKQLEARIRYQLADMSEEDLKKTLHATQSDSV